MGSAWRKRRLARWSWSCSSWASWRRFARQATCRHFWRGCSAGLLASWVTFAPCFLWIFLGAPYIEKIRSNKAFSGALAAITAAVVGVILNLAIWFAIHTIFRKTVAVDGYGLSFDAPVLASVDFWSLALSVAAAIAIFRLRVGVLQTLAGSCLAGIGLFLVGAI